MQLSVAMVSLGLGGAGLRTSTWFQSGQPVVLPCMALGLARLALIRLVRLKTENKKLSNDALGAELL